MKVVVQRIFTDPRYVRALEWGRLITITGSTQLIVQLTGFVSGIFIVRLLSTQEYALYTLANTMLGTMTILSDSGIANGVMVEGGKVWQDKAAIGVVLSTGLKLRKKFGAISLIVTLPILAYLLLTHGASWVAIALIIAAIIPAFFAALSDSLLEIVPKLHQDIKPLQRNQAEVSLGRMVLSGLFIFAFPYTFIALIANGIPRIYGNYQLKKISSQFANIGEHQDKVVEASIIKSVRKTLPIVIYGCISGQLSIWLISFFGTAANISQLGALGRLSVGFNLCATIFSTLIVPRFSRMNPSKKMLLRYFILIQIATFAVSILLLILVWLFSTQILLILGKSYSGLNFELLLVGISSAVGLMASVCSQVVISRGWFFNPYLLIATNFISTVIALGFLDISTFIGTLYFSIFTTLISYILGLIYGLININKI